MITLTIARQRKLSRNFQSEGFSAAITAELDSGLLTRPSDLQAEIDRLFAEVDAALDRQEAKQPPTSAPASPPPRPPVRQSNVSQRPPNGNGQTPHDGARRANGASITDSQKRAIRAIANRAGVDPVHQCREVLGYDPAMLTVRQASELITHLQQLARSASRGNGRSL